MTAQEAQLDAQIAALATLKELLNDPHPEIRIAAAKALLLAG